MQIFRLIYGSILRVRTRIGRPENADRREGKKYLPTLTCRRNWVVVVLVVVVMEVEAVVVMVVAWGARGGRRDVDGSVGGGGRGF